MVKIIVRVWRNCKNKTCLWSSEESTIFSPGSRVLGEAQCLLIFFFLIRIDEESRLYLKQRVEFLLSE